MNFTIANKCMVLNKNSIYHGNIVLLKCLIIRVFYSR